jgi:hypothetical protein
MTNRCVRFVRAMGVSWIFATVVAGCQDARDEMTPPPPSDEAGPPFAKSAPELNWSNHKSAWQRTDCSTCHLPRLVEGHGSFGDAQCRKCHGNNGTAGSGCNDCHDVPNPQGFPNSGLHEFHVLDKLFSCGDCHTNSIHRNGAVDVSFQNLGRFLRSHDESGGESFPEVFAFPGCSESGCHEPRRWTTDACKTCHSTPPESRTHAKHLNPKSRLTCRDCHANAPHDADICSGKIEVGGPKWTRWNPFTGSCESECHQKTEKWDCQSCHGYPPKTGAHTKHVTEYQIECSVCHSAHAHTFQAAMSPNDSVATVKVSFLFQRGTWNKKTDMCLSTGCHVDRSWR